MEKDPKTGAGLDEDAKCETFLSERLIVVGLVIVERSVMLKQKWS